MDSFSHKALCALAVAWLQRPHSRQGPGCTVALAETGNAINGEIPDAIGWRPFDGDFGGSVMVEAKVSRADFLADAAKAHRKDPSLGMGTFRYYLAPQGLIALEELPARWGLVEVNSRGHLKVRAGHVLCANTRIEESWAAWRHARNEGAEVSLLAMCLARVGDPQKLQEMLRAANRRATALEAEFRRRETTLKAHCARLVEENHRLRKAHAGQGGSVAGEEPFLVVGAGGLPRQARRALSSDEA